MAHSSMEDQGGEDRGLGLSPDQGLPSLCTMSPEPSRRFVLTYIHLPPSSGRVFPGQQVLYDNGHEYLLVDDHCHYWAFNSLDGHRAWNPRVVGRLSEGQAGALLARLDWANWKPFIEKNGPTHQSPMVLKALGKSVNFECSGCQGTPVDLVREVLGELVAAGREPTPSSLRYLIYKAEEETLPAYKNIPAHPLPKAHLTWLDSEELSTIGYGQSFLLEDAEVVKKLWALRETYMGWSVEQWWYAYVPLSDEEGNRYLVYFRAVFPELEDETGIISGLRFR